MAEAARVYQEEHAHSLTSMRGVGRVAVRGCEIDYGNGYIQEGFQDFTTAVGENLATDATFGERLIFNPMRSYRYRDGRTLADSGQPVVELVEDGLQASEYAAQTDPEMRIHAVRDRGDVRVMKIVDGLAVGEMYVVTSLDPKKALARNRAYWEAKGYREGMAVVQVYYRASETEMLAGAYSVKNSSKQALANIFARYGTHIPLDESDNHWINHGIRMRVDREDAEEFGKGIIRAHQAEIGQGGEALSVTELITTHERLVRACFESYIVPLARSLETSVTDSAIQELAQRMLQNGAHYKAADVHGLMRLANGGQTYEADVRIMEEKVRYALVEELRKLVPHYLSSAKAEPSLIGDVQPRSVRPHVFEQAAFMQNMGHIMAGNVANGMAANRSYGGCASAGGSDGLTLGKDSEYGAEQQDTFGGTANSTRSDKFGPLRFKCPKGHWNERPVARSSKDFLTHCKQPGCGVSLKC